MAGCTDAPESSESRGLGSFPLDSESLQQWKLPKALKEISGLALTSDDRLFAVGDEAAIVYELDYREGKIIKAFTLGEPAVRGDFEGIAHLESRFYLVTSDGLLYAADEGNKGDNVQFELYNTGLGKRCEIEGLAQDRRANTLLLVCKTSRARIPGAGLSIFAWSPAIKDFLAEPEIAIPERDIAKSLNKKRVNPSGIAVDPESANLYVIAARQRAIIEMKPNGELVDAIILPLKRRHRQAEGIEISSDGKLLIADEGGDKEARLSVYSPGHNKVAGEN